MLGLGGGTSSGSDQNSTPPTSVTVISPVKPPTVGSAPYRNLMEVEVESWLNYSLRPQK